MSANISILIQNTLNDINISISDINDSMTLSEITQYMTLINNDLNSLASAIKYTGSGSGGGGKLGGISPLIEDPNMSFVFNFLLFPFSYENENGVIFINLLQITDASQIPQFVQGVLLLFTLIQYNFQVLISKNITQFVIEERTSVDEALPWPALPLILTAITQNNGMDLFNMFYGMGVPFNSIIEMAFSINPYILKVQPNLKTTNPDLSSSMLQLMRDLSLPASLLQLQSDWSTYISALSSFVKEYSDNPWLNGGSD